MNTRFIVALVCSTACSIGASGSATAEMVGRFECSVVGTPSQEPIGDRDGHRLANLQYACFGVDGLLKSAVYTGSATSEWDGPRGTFLAAGGIYRVAGGLAVSQVSEGTSSVVMKDGKPAGNESSGKALFRFASGTLAALSGKAIRFDAKPMGFGRFSLELTADGEPGAVRTSQQ
jgi:hypothetical protein